MQLLVSAAKDPLYKGEVDWEGGGMLAEQTSNSSMLDFFSQLCKVKEITFLALYGIIISFL